MFHWCISFMFELQNSCSQYLISGAAQLNKPLQVATQSQGSFNWPHHTNKDFIVLKEPKRVRLYSSFYRDKCLLLESAKSSLTLAIIKVKMYWSLVNIELLFTALAIDKHSFFSLDSSGIWSTDLNRCILQIPNIDRIEVLHSLCKLKRLSKDTLLKKNVTSYHDINME
jgi:hypothetical protein